MIMPIAEIVIDVVVVVAVANSVGNDVVASLLRS
jgi:hypothetical protein